MSRQDREGEHVGRGDREEKRRLPRGVGGREHHHRIRKIVDGPKELNRSQNGGPSWCNPAQGAGPLTRPVFAMASASSLPAHPVWALTWWNRTRCSSRARRRRFLARWTGAAAWWALERPSNTPVAHLLFEYVSTSSRAVTEQLEAKAQKITRYRRHRYWKQAHHHGTLRYDVTVPNPSGQRQPLPIQHRAAEGAWNASSCPNRP